MKSLSLSLAVVFALSCPPAVGQNDRPMYALDAERPVDSSVRKQFSGRVRSVSDGDTIVVEDRDSQRNKVRLFGIDAPERGRYGQPFAQKARKNLSDLVYRKIVRVEWHTYDGYGRMVARVWLDGNDVGLHQVCSGYAWVFRRFAEELTPTERKSYEDCEQLARKERRGLWRDRKPVPPWEWRHSEWTRELQP
jgi:endonuclease YncB( thermonuclease family)